MWIDGNYYGGCGNLGDFAGGSGDSGGDSPSLVGSLLVLVLCILMLWGMWKHEEKMEKKYQTCLQRHTYLWCDDHYGSDGKKSDAGLNLHTMIEENK